MPSSVSSASATGSSAPDWINTESWAIDLPGLPDVMVPPNSFPPFANPDGERLHTFLDLLKPQIFRTSMIAWRISSIPSDFSDEVARMNG